MIDLELQPAIMGTVTTRMNPVRSPSIVSKYEPDYVQVFVKRNKAKKLGLHVQRTFSIIGKETDIESFLCSMTNSHRDMRNISSRLLRRVHGDFEHPRMLLKQVIHTQKLLRSHSNKMAFGFVDGIPVLCRECPGRWIWVSRCIQYFGSSISHYFLIVCRPKIDKRNLWQSLVSVIPKSLDFSFDVYEGQYLNDTRVYLVSQFLPIG